VPGQIGKLFRRDGDAYAFEFGFQLRQLVWLPLAFVRVRACGAQQRGWND
jgi:hypothetical protein